MIRTIAAMFVGLATALFVVTFVRSIGLSVYPLPEGMDMADAEALALYIETIPTGALLFSLASWWLGTMAGGLGACSMAKEKPAFFTFIVGGALLGMVSKALRASDYPAWFNGASVLGIIVSMIVCVALAKRFGFDLPSQRPQAEA